MNQNTCATAKLIKPVSGQPGKFEVQPPIPNTPNSFYVNFESQIGLTSEYLFFDGNKIAVMSLSNAPLDFTFGSSFDPGAAATGTQQNEGLARMAGSTPFILNKMRLTVTSGQLFEGSVTLYIGGSGGVVNRQPLDVNAAVNPGNQQGNVLDFFMPKNFVVDGFIAFGVLLPATVAVQTYTMTFEFGAIAANYEMQSPCLDACEVIG